MLSKFFSFSVYHNYRFIQDVGVFKTKCSYKKDGEGNNTKPHICEKIYLEEKIKNK